MSAPEEDDIYTGDLVELVVQPRIYGMAIGFEGSLIHVRLVDGSRQVFHEYELRKMAGVEAEPVRNDNVVDFTKAVADLKAAKTKGRA